MTANESINNLHKDYNLHNTDLDAFYKDQTVSGANLDAFYKSCLAFYIELTVVIVKRFDSSDPLFELISVVEPYEAQAFTLNL